MASWKRDSRACTSASTHGALFEQRATDATTVDLDEAVTARTLAILHVATASDVLWLERDVGLDELSDGQVESLPQSSSQSQP
jgi:hypothetical protein